MKLAVTGSTGFIGRELCSTVRERGGSLRAFARQSGNQSGVELTPIGDMAGTVDWAPLLDGVDCVIHLAGRAHVMGADPDAEWAFERANVHASVQLSRGAVTAGVRRLVYVSSIHVNGTATTRPFRGTDTPAPAELYGISKLRAERCLGEIAAETGLELVVVRPPLVYGPGAPGNFGRLVRLVRRGVPLPFGGIDNRRSLVARSNLVDLLLRCAEHPDAPGVPLLAADGEDLSTPELVRRIARALGRRATLLSLPPSILELAGFATGRRAEVERLTGSLQVDIADTRSRLDWQPPLSVDAAMQAAVRPQD